MNKVEFPEEQAFLISSQREGENKASRRGLFALLIRWRLAKDETGAMIILVAAGVLALVLTAAIFVVAYSS